MEQPVEQQAMEHAQQPQQQQQQQQQHGGPATADVPHLRDASKQGPPHMHAKLLSLHPQHFEQVYFEQLEALDLVNCIICPLFFANALLIWTRSLLNAVYCLVLLVKGYQLGLLLLPAARRQRAYRRSRYYLILAERVLRQWVATPALGHGPRFIPWLRQLQHTTSPALLVVKLLVLISGVTISFWNAFCLPLDFVSQAVLNTLFLCIHFPPNVTQVAYGVAVLVRSHRYLGWAQWGLEEAARRLLPAALVAAAAAGNSSLSSSSSSSSASTSAGAAAMCLIRSAAANFTAVAGSSMGGSCAAPQGALLSAASSAAAAVYAPARRAPDLDSVAGRLVLALSTAWMLFAVLIVPLYLAWRMERHLKSKFLATVTLTASPLGDGAAGTLLPHQHQQLEQQQQQQQPLPPLSKHQACMPTSGGGGSAGGLGVYPFIPSVWQLLHDLAVAAAASLAVGEAFVGLCVLSPRVAGMLWQQVLDVDV